MQCLQPWAIGHNDVIGREARDSFQLFIFSSYAYVHKQNRMSNANIISSAHQNIAVESDSQRTSRGTWRVHSMHSPREEPSAMLSVDGTHKKKTDMRNLTENCHAAATMALTSGLELRPKAIEPLAPVLSMKKATLQPCTRAPHLTRDIVAAMTSNGKICVFRACSSRKPLLGYARQTTHSRCRWPSDHRFAHSSLRPSTRRRTEGRRDVG